jgi:integrase
MNKPDESNEPIGRIETARRFRDATRAGALLIFPIESIQHLDFESALRCQQLLGHGCVPGVWETPMAMAPHLATNLRSIDLRKRIMAYLLDASESTSPTSSGLPGQNENLAVLLDEAVLWMSRFALLMRMAPTVPGQRLSRRPLDATTIAVLIYQHITRIMARAVARRMDDPRVRAGEFIARLTDGDLRALLENRQTPIEFKRIARFHEMGLWPDAPAKPTFERNETDPKGTARPPTPQDKTHEYQHIPDNYMALMGPRVLWVVQNLGPGLVDMYERIPDLLEDLCSAPETGYGTYKWRRRRLVAEYLRDNVMIEAPPFALNMGRLPLEGGDSDHQWQPTNFKEIKKLAGHLQSAHLWIALLAMSGRISEVLTLGRDCIEFARDGKRYANGKTYKLSSRIDGEERTWVLPDIAADALAQQARLVTAWERIARQQRGAADGDDDTFKVEGGHLWASLGISGSCNPEKILVHAGKVLRSLAVRLGLSARPGGINLHPHRFRKTIARLVGIAIVNSPRTLQLVFGHKDIQMTLYYIRSDKALAVEIEKVTRELKIMRCERMIEDMHAARGRSDVSPLGGYGGPGARVLAKTVENHEEELHRKGEDWGAHSAHELAEILTAGGRNFTLVGEHSVCSKGPGEAGLCSKKLGDPVTSNCQSECINLIEEKTGRRDVHKIIPILVGNWKRARDERQLLVMAGYEEQLRRELGRFEDINATLGADPDVALILAERA